MFYILHGNKKFNCYICLTFQSLEELITSVTQATSRLLSRGHCTPADYENVTRSLRYQLVAMAMGYMCQQSTPRIEVKVFIHNNLYLCFTFHR